MAARHNLALGLFSLHGITKIKQKVRATGRNPPARRPADPITSHSVISNRL
jgi:hypothetical protein